MVYPLNLRSRIFYVPLVLASLAASIYLLGVIFNFLGNFSNIFFILIMGWVIAVILGPVVKYAKKHGVSPSIAIISSFILMLLLAAVTGLFVFPSLYQELNALAGRISSVDFMNTIKLISGNLHLVQYNVSGTFITHLNQFISYLITNSVSFVGNFFTVLLDIILAFFFAFYFLYEGERWKKFLLEKLPDNFKEDFLVITDSINEGLQGFIKGQTIIALIMAIATMVIMRILGLNLIVVAGLYVFILMYFPVIGPPVSTIFPLLVAAGSSFSALIIMVVALFVISQVVVNVIQPKVFSKSLGIHPVLVVLSVLVGGQLFGIGGALLALPAASIIQSLLIHYYK